MLTLDELIEPCPKCSGTGKKVIEPRMNIESSGSHKTLNLDTSDCDACGGYGRGALTETGKALLDFIRIVKRRDMI
jgi:hypothetical protein